MDYAELVKLKCDAVRMQELRTETSFLDHLPHIPIRQRIWHTVTATDSIPKCKSCNNQVKWTEATSRYRVFCSSKCSKLDPQVRKRTEDTCLEKYGHKTNLQSTDTKDKIKTALLARYGVDNPFKAPAVQSKIRKTNLDRYGNENVAKTDLIKAKSDLTNFTRYGRKRQSQSHLSLDVIALKNDPEKMRELFLSKRLPVSEIAELLGVSHSQLCVHFKDNLGIDISRHMVSTVERTLREYVATFSEVRYSDRTIIKPKELDIVVDSHKIAFELHGLAWHCESRGKSNHYHVDKMRACHDMGYRLVQITDEEFINKNELVRSRIATMFGKNNKIHARSCKIIELSSIQAATFLEENHIQGNCISVKRYGLLYDEQLVALMTFGKSRFSNKAQWELLRYVSKKWSTVVGGASKLFKHFIRMNSPRSVISYCDLRWNIGTLYEKLGFTLDHVTGPNYWYSYKYLTFENRINYQKHKLAKILSIYDPAKTEWENMQLNGYDRFWDCGNKVFIWHPA